MTRETSDLERRLLSALLSLEGGLRREKHPVADALRLSLYWTLVEEGWTGEDARALLSQQDERLKETASE